MPLPSWPGSSTPLSRDSTAARPGDYRRGHAADAAAGGQRTCSSRRTGDRGQRTEASGQVEEVRGVISIGTDSGQGGGVTNLIVNGT